MPKLSELPVAPTINTGDIIPIVQNSVNMRTTVGAVAGFGGSSGGTTTANGPGESPLDSFAGSTDDAKLDAALAYAAAQTYPPTITLTNRQYTFVTANRVAYTGLRISGPAGYGNPERLGQTKMPGRVSLGFTGPWFHNNGVDVFSASFHQLSLTGGSNATFLGQSGGGTWYCLGMRDIFTSGLRSVLGTTGTKLLITAASFNGHWEINNCYSTAFHMGGSDNAFWTDGMLLDSGTAFNSSPGMPHIWMDFMTKSDVGPLYITAEGPWAGIRVTGSGYGAATNNPGGPVTFRGMRVEGRNTNQPSQGALLRVDGGLAIVRDSWFGYSMSNPGAWSAARNPVDAGVVHVSNGAALIDGCTIARASGVAETVPLVYSASSGQVRVRNIFANESWTGLPRVTGASIRADDSVTVV